MATTIQTTKSKIQTFLNDIPTGIVKEVPLALKEVSFICTDEMKNEKRAIVRVPSTGKEYTVEDPVCYDLLYYWRTEPEVAGKNLSAMSAADLTELTAKLIARKPKDIKLQLDSTGKVISVRSAKARQVNWKDAMGNVFDAVQSVYKLSPEDIELHTSRSYTVKLPLKTSILQFYCEIYSGSNIGRDTNRSIAVGIRARTIAPLAGMEAACMNWCTFRDSKSFFGIKDSSILNLRGKLIGLGFTAIHTEAGKGKLVTIEDMFRQQKVNVEAAGKLIDQYVHTPLSDREINVLLAAYQAKFKFPKYVSEDIPELINEKTIWGLSNAFSFFRTHCEYKNSKLDRELSALTKKLEFAAGELIVASPLLCQLKKLNGELTKKVLFPNEEKQ